MKCIIVIRGVEFPEYTAIVASLKQQLNVRGVEEKDMPLFALLPNLEGERAEIEIVWLDPAMELEHLKIINSKLCVKDVTDNTNAATSDDYAALYDSLRQTHI